VTSISRAKLPKIPAVIRLFGPVGALFLRFGVPMGPDTLMTVRGRTSGQPRTVGVAVVEVGGRRFVVGAYGDVNWCRNLRAAGEAHVRIGRRQVPVTATELGPEEASGFFRDVLVPYIDGLPWILRQVTLFMMRFGNADQIMKDPESAGRERPVFELHLQ
jgi:deazaflavin-dependent oxidoreductase (nitroreductase family)